MCANKAPMRTLVPNPKERVVKPSERIEREDTSKIRSVDLLIHRSSPNETGKKNEVQSDHSLLGQDPAPRNETKQVTYTNRLIAPSMSVNPFDTFDVSQSKESPTGKKNQEALGFTEEKTSKGNKGITTVERLDSKLTLQDVFGPEENREESDILTFGKETIELYDSTDSDTAVQEEAAVAIDNRPTKFDSSLKEDYFSCSSENSEAEVEITGKALAASKKPVFADSNTNADGSVDINTVINRQLSDLDWSLRVTQSTDSATNEEDAWVSSLLNMSRTLTSKPKKVTQTQTQTPLRKVIHPKVTPTKSASSDTHDEIRGFSF